MENKTESKKSETKSENTNVDNSSNSKKTVKPPKLEDKPFYEFINNYFNPGLKKSIPFISYLRTGLKLDETILHPQAIYSNNFVGVFSSVRGFFLNGIPPTECLFNFFHISFQNIN